MLDLKLILQGRDEWKVSRVLILPALVTGFTFFLDPGSEVMFLLVVDLVI